MRKDRFKSAGETPALAVASGLVFRVGDAGRSKPRPYKGVAI